MVLTDHVKKAHSEKENPSKILFRTPKKSIVIGAPESSPVQPELPQIPEESYHPTTVPGKGI